jgi:hypothetical protein
LHGHGCPKCGDESSSIKQTYTSDQALARCHSVHGYKYDYSKTIYKGVWEPIEMGCPNHGYFWQVPAYHFSGHGCPQCGDDITFNAKRSNKEDFVIAANKRHNNTYTYDLVEYINCDTKVKITCKEHGVFEQTPYKHLLGQQCPRCAGGNISKMETDWLDGLGIPNEYRNTTININGALCFPDALVGTTIYEFYGDYWHGNPIRYDPEAINATNGKTFGQLYERTLYREEMLKTAGYDLITIWESEWVAQ